MGPCSPHGEQGPILLLLTRPEDGGRQGTALRRLVLGPVRGRPRHTVGVGYRSETLALLHDGGRAGQWQESQSGQSGSPLRHGGSPR